MGDQCEKNHAFMAEQCPAACNYCENAGLFATPSSWQLDFVCKDHTGTSHLAIKPGTFSGAAEELPAGCEFRCRDNMTSCATIAQDGLCEKKDVASVVRFQCPQSCGVCKALSLPTEPSYPRHKCAHEEGDAPSHKDHCGGWASSGECVRNFAFMKLSCEFSCGLCSLDGSTPAEYRKILKPPAKTTSGGAKKKKKKVKKSVGTAAAEANTDAAEGGTTKASVSATAAVESVEAKGAPTEPPKEAPKEEAPKKKKAAEASPKADKPKPAKDAPAKPTKKKGWMSGLADAVGGAFKGGKKGGGPKDEA